MSTSPAIPVFLDRNYSHKSVATQISHDIGLALIPDIVQKFFPPQEVEPAPNPVVLIQTNKLYPHNCRARS